MRITHKKAALPFPPDDETLIGGPDWNEDHVLSGPRLVAMGYMPADSAPHLEIGGGMEIVPYYENEEEDPKPGFFVLRLLPSSGASLGSAAHFQAAGGFIEIEFWPNLEERFYPNNYFWTDEVGSIRVWEYGEEWLMENGAQVTDEDGEPIRKGLIFQAMAAAPGGSGLSIDPTPWMSLKISVWFGLFPGGQ